MTDRDAGSEESFRPALMKLSIDLGDLESELIDGFDSPRDVVEWSQELTVVSLGRIDDSWYYELARQFKGRPSDCKERTLLSALLKPDVRRRDLDEQAARQLRANLVSNTIRPAYHQAFRKLRDDATEYTDGDGAESKHRPDSQRYPAMRPALEELNTYQKTALEDALDGFETPAEILEWTRDVELATHGEISEEFTRRCFDEPSTSSVLCSNGEHSERARLLFTSHFLIPAFNRGVRDLAERAGEMPREKATQREVKMA